jgi:adenine/guanine phosphoribosyltransferase-like PRPP-binding protein
MENPKYLMKDLGAEVSQPIEFIEKEHADLIERAKHELEVIRLSLKDLVAKIESEKPDVVLILDKGARILAAPIRKYLHDHMGEHTPKVQRYNDDRLKTPFLKDESIDEIVAEDFAPLSGQKVFYIDETFSSGKGAVALDAATKQAGIDMKYFALTRESHDQKDLSPKAPFEQGKFYGLALEEYKKEFERIQSDPRFTIYPNDIPTLFTKDAAALAVVDPNGVTKSRYELVPESEVDSVYDYAPKRGALPNGRRYDHPPAGMSWQEFDEKVRDMNMNTVRTLTHMIYEVLEKEVDVKGYEDH